MKKGLLLLVAVIFTTSIIYAQNEENKELASEPAVPVKGIVAPHQVNPPHFISGEILNIDTSNPGITILTIKDLVGEEIMIEVNPNLSITKIISPSELNLGDNIRVTYEEKDNKKITRNIFLGRPHPLRLEEKPKNKIIENMPALHQNSTGPAGSPLGEAEDRQGD